jgi:hypothetical protein
LAQDFATPNRFVPTSPKAKAKAQKIRNEDRSFSNAVRDY